MSFHRSPFFILLAAASVYGQASIRLSGVVRDASTKEPIPRASVTELGTKRGAIANREGRFTLQLPVGIPSRLRITAIGYMPDTIIASEEKLITVLLRPNPITSDVVVVTSDASRVEARRIMREVIRRKKLWRDKLADYTCSAYSRWNIRSISGGDTVVRSVVESRSNGYWRKDDGFFSRITERTQTANFPAEANLFSVGPVMNFYNDRVDLASYSITSPAADDAFDVYDYDLVGSGQINGSPVYKIVLDPGTLPPAFDGMLWIDQNDYTIAYLDLMPSKAVKLGPLKELRMQQTFDLFRDTFWMPIDLRTTIAIKTELPLVPQFNVELLSDIEEYKINTNVPDSFFTGKKYTALADADSVDEKKWAETRSIPLAFDEERAYVRLDSVEAVSVADSTDEDFSIFTIFSWLPSINFPVYNQIEGLRLGISKSVTPVQTFPLTLDGSLAYGLNDKIWKYSLGLRQGIIWTSKRSPTVSYGASGDFDVEYKEAPDVVLAVKASYFTDLTPRGIIYTAVETSTTSLIYKEDYSEFFRQEGWRVGLDFEPVRDVSLSLTYLNSQIWNAGKLTLVMPDSLAHIRREYNAIAFESEGKFTFGSLRLGLRADVNTTAKALGSDADFTTGAFELSLSERLGGWGNAEVFLRYGQTFAGPLPRWNMMYFETRNKFSSKFGYFRGLETFEFMGDRIWSAHLEHNFYDLPTRWMGIGFLDELNLHWRLHGGIGASDILRSGSADVPTTIDKPYAEAGAGIGNIMNLFTVEGTWRVTHRGEHNFYPTIAVQLTF